MKYKVSISNISFDMELTSVDGVIINDPIVIPDPVIVREPDPIVVPAPILSNNITLKWYDDLSNSKVTGIVIDGLCYIDHIKRIPINRKLTITGINNATLVFGVENYISLNGMQDGSLFMLGNGAEVLIENVNICQPSQIKSIQPWMPTIFSSVQDPNAKWTAIVKDCDTTAMGRNGGFGLGLVYGGKHENHIAAINFKHVGNAFLEGKASIGNNEGTVLAVTLNNVKTDGGNEEEFAAYKFMVKGFIKDDVFTITSDHETSVIYNHFFNTDHNDNYAHILHLGRFTFMLDDNSVLNNKQFKLRPNADFDIRIRVLNGNVYTPGFESHAGDNFVYYNEYCETTEKWRDEHPIWSNNFKPLDSDISYHPFLKIDKKLVDGYYDVSWNSSFDQEGINQDACIIAKGNDSFRSYPNTKFGNWEILSGQIVGHNMYNHKEITLWAKDVKQSGYYRQTSGVGKSLGYNMVDCKGFKNEFNPNVNITTSNTIPMPKRIIDLLG
jgi:hypothetical protein